MKREYVTPTAVCEVFAANDYVAACVNTDWVYKFKCTAPASANVYVESNGVAGLQTTASGYGYNRVPADTQICGGYSGLRDYHPCGATHDVTVPIGTAASSEFLSGYLGDGTSVIVWRGENNNNVHCQLGLDPSEIEVVKS